MKRVAFTIGLGAMAALSACSEGTTDAPEEAPIQPPESERSGLRIYDATPVQPRGVSDDWGDNANCAPTGCTRSDPPGGERRNRGSNGNDIAFEPTILSLVLIVLGENDDAVSYHASYPLDDCVAALGNNAHEILLDKFEGSGRTDWPSEECAPESSGKNFANWNFASQAKIYMDIEGQASEFNENHPIIFTKYSVDNRVDRKKKNYAFYSASIVGNSIQDDTLLYMENYFSHRRQRTWSKIGNRNPTGCWRNRCNYSMNIHFKTGTGRLAFVFDPDTGNGNDN